MLNLKTPLEKEPYFIYFCIPNSMISKLYAQVSQSTSVKHDTRSIMG